MLTKDDGVVLKSSPSGTTSKLVTFLGKKSGKIKLIAKGAMKKDSPFRSSLEAGAIVEAVYYFKEGREIFFLKEVFVRAPRRAGETLPSMVSDLAALELLDKLCYRASPDARIVALAEEFLTTDSEDPLKMFLAFELKMLEILGTLPQFHNCSICQKDLKRGFFDPSSALSVCEDHLASIQENYFELEEELLQTIKFILSNSFSEVSDGEVPKRTRKELGSLLHATYTYHVQGYALPKAFALLNENQAHR